MATSQFIISQAAMVSYSTGLGCRPSASKLGGGNIIVSYTTRPSQGQDNICARIVDTNGNLIGQEFNVNDNASPPSGTAFSSIFPTSTTLSSGEVIILWQGTNSILVGQRFDVNGNKLGINFIIPSSKSASSSQPSIASMNNGKYVVMSYVVFTIGLNSILKPAIFFMSSSDTVISGPIQLEPSPSPQSADTAVAMLSNGNIIACWRTQGFTSLPLLTMQMYNQNGNNVTDVVQVSTFSSGSNDINGILTLRALTSGGFVVVWDGVNPSNNIKGIYGQKFDANANKVGSEFSATTVITSQSSRQDINNMVLLSDGGFILTWEANPSSSISNLQAYMQRFNSNATAITTVSTLSDFAQATTCCTYGLSVNSFTLSGTTYDTVLFVWRNQTSNFATGTNVGNIAGSIVNFTNYFTPAAIPVAQPIGVPVAVPVGTPVGVPIGVPIATPISVAIPVSVPVSVPLNTIYITSSGSFVGTSGNDKFVVITRSDVTITTGLGSDEIVIYPNGVSSLLITDFDVNSDTVSLVGFNTNCADLTVA